MAFYFCHVKGSHTKGITKGITRIELSARSLVRFQDHSFIPI